MDRIRQWGAEICGGTVSFLCWFTPEHCSHASTVLAMVIGFITLFFITIPNAINAVRRMMRRRHGKL